MFNKNSKIYIFVYKILIFICYVNYSTQQTNSANDNTESLSYCLQKRTTNFPECASITDNFCSMVILYIYTNIN